MAVSRYSLRDLSLPLTVAVLVIGLCLSFLGWRGWQLHSAISTPIELQEVVSSLNAVVPEIPVSLPSTGSPQIPLTDPTPWQGVLITFVTVFVAEMGDKTQLATMLMSAQSRSPWAIFFGSASALVTASLISVTLGEGLSQVLSPKTLQTVAGLGFIAIGVLVLWQERNKKGDPEPIPDKEQGKEEVLSTPHISVRADVQH